MHLHLALLLWAATAVPTTAPPPAWKASHARAAASRDALSTRLAEVHRNLRARLAAEEPALLAKLDPTPPRPSPRGYGVLPLVVPDEPEGTGEPTESRYSLVSLAEWEAREHGYLAELAAKVEYRVGSLASLVDAYLLRAENFRRIDQHVSYHAFWQTEPQRASAFYARRKDILAEYRIWRVPAKDDAAKARAEVARHRLEAETLGFWAKPDLRMARDSDGACVLPVAISTDIEDEAFLFDFAHAVERFWNGAETMRNAGLRIQFAWIRRPLDSLYAECPPAPGEAIDIDKHGQRFGPGAHVLTTGADSTHGGDIIALAPGTMPRHVLAHEFAHFLGFGDAYLRAYEGSPEDPDGVVFVEVIPFPESILAAPGTGKVTDWMVQQLLAAYTRPGVAP